MKRDTAQSAGWLAVLWMALFANGCIYHPSPSPGPDDKTNPAPTPSNVSAVERAANESFAQYRLDLANVCASLRADLKTKTYRDAAEFFAEWEKLNKAAREKSLTPYAEAVNAELFQRKPDGSWKTDGPFDAAEVDRVLMEAERGLRGK